MDDKNTYEKLEKDPTSKYKDKLIGILQKLEKDKVITNVEKRKLYPTSEDSPKFYGLPKIHKAEAPLRPIVSCIGSISYEIASFVADIIGPLAGRTAHHLKNSQDLVEKLSSVTINEHEVLISYDISALFTSVPVDDSIVIIRDRLIHDDTLAERTTLSPDQIIELLSFCLKTTYFQFNDCLYRQVEGAAMGSPVSPIVANLFMEDFEQRALNSSPHPVKIWYRYVDDTICIMDKDHVDDFTHHINSINDAIKFTTEPEVNNSIAMLDTKITRHPDGSMTCGVYRKPTHTDQYLNFGSHHPLQHKLGVVRTLTHRANTIITHEEDRQQEMHHIQNCLSKCGYEPWVFALSNNKETDKQKAKYAKRPPAKGSVVIPCVQGVSETFARVYQSKGICTHYKPVNSIRQQLVAPKDKIKTVDKCGVVYQLNCQECPAAYGGESERALRTRVGEHKRPSNATSPVAQHAKQSKHRIGWSNVKVLDQDSNYFSRGVREAINIYRHPSSLNRDKCRHQLPPVYQSILSHDRRSTRSCDNQDR